MGQRFITEGSPEWESVCEQCGICCLVKHADEFGNIFLTNIRCAALDKDTRKCKCYAPDMDSRDNGCENCIALGGSPVTRETLNNDYPVPSFCPYAQKFCENPAIKKAPKKRPNIDWANTVSETDVDDHSFKKYVIKNSDKYFRYLPELNKKIRDFAMGKSK